MRKILCTIMLLTSFGAPAMDAPKDWLDQLKRHIESTSPNTSFGHNLNSCIVTFTVFTLGSPRLSLNCGDQLSIYYEGIPMETGEDATPKEMVLPSAYVLDLMLRNGWVLVPTGTDLIGASGALFMQTFIFVRKSQ